VPSWLCFSDAVTFNLTYGYGQQSDRNLGTGGVGDAFSLNPLHKYSISKPDLARKVLHQLQPPDHNENQKLLKLLVLALLSLEFKADRLSSKLRHPCAKLVPNWRKPLSASIPNHLRLAAEGSTTGIAAIIDGTAKSACRAAAPSRGKSSGLRKSVNMKPTIAAYDASRDLNSAIQSRA